MTYCKLGEKPKINYKFANTNQRTYESSKSPIEVGVTRLQNNSTGLGDSILYDVTFKVFHGDTSDPCGEPNRVFKQSLWGSIGEVTNYDPKCGSGIGSTNPSFFIYCRGTLGENSSQPSSPYQIRRIYIGAHIYDFSAISKPEIIDIKVNPKSSDPKNLIECQLQVKHNNQIIFYDTGKCPCDFEVICGDCPEGFLKCEKPEYPGYCCIPCNEIKAELVASRVALRMLKNG